MVCLSQFCNRCRSCLHFFSFVANMSAAFSKMRFGLSKNCSLKLTLSPGFNICSQTFWQYRLHKLSEHVSNNENVFSANIVKWQWFEADVSPTIVPIWMCFSIDYRRGMFHSCRCSTCTSFRDAFWASIHDIAIT